LFLRQQAIGATIGRSSFLSSLFKKAFICFITQQMSGRIVTSIFVALLIFAIYSWYSTRTAMEGFDINSQQYAEAEVYHPPPPAIQRAVIPAGPNAPNQLASPNAPAVIMREEKPYDPQAETHESAKIPERLRHPERMYSPGLVNDDVQTAVAAGTASYASSLTQDAHQVFGPEFAQNGSIFMDGVMANDTELKSEYSSV
jgi:cell division protein FtsN